MNISPRFHIRRFKIWYHLIYKHEEKSGLKFKLPFFFKLKYNLLGFSDLHIVAYDLAHNDYRNYISTLERWRLEDVNGRFAFFLGEKVMFERTFGRYVNVPHIHCWVKCGKFIDLDHNTDEISLIDEIKREKCFIAKPTRSLGGGKKIHELTWEEGTFAIDGETMGEKVFLDRCRKMEEYIFTKKIQSHEYSKAIYPHSANSIRIISVMDNKTNESDVLLAFHRFGTKQSSFVDNISSGGVFSLINLETGKLSAAKSLFDPGTSHKTHPDTGANIEGIAVPRWNNIIESIKIAHKCFPYYRFFAWDVVIAHDGKPWIMEINRGSDLGIQAIAPLRNEKLGQWMGKNGLLRSK